MTEKEEIVIRLKELDRELDLHIKIHHSGDNAGVLKMMKCLEYKNIVNEQFALLSRYKVLTD